MSKWLSPAARKMAEEDAKRARVDAAVGKLLSGDAERRQLSLRRLSELAESLNEGVLAVRRLQEVERVLRRAEMRGAEGDPAKIIADLRYALETYE